MLRKNTNEIIGICNKMIKDYDGWCIDSPPGEEGIHRKEEFERIINTLEGNTPEEAFFKLYRFERDELDKQSYFNPSTPHFLSLLQETLPLLFDIQLRPELSDKYSGRDLYFDKVSKLKKTYPELYKKVKAKGFIEGSILVDNISFPAKALSTDPNCFFSKGKVDPKKYQEKENLTFYKGYQLL